jgi:hypothetical protein
LAFPIVQIEQRHKATAAPYSHETLGRWGFAFAPLSKTTLGWVKRALLIAQNGGGMIGAKFPASFLLESALPSIATVVIIYVGRFANRHWYWTGPGERGIYTSQSQYDLLLEWRGGGGGSCIPHRRSIQSIPRLGVSCGYKGRSSRYLMCVSPPGVQRSTFNLQYAA